MSIFLYNDTHSIYINKCKNESNNMKNLELIKVLDDDRLGQNFLDHLKNPKF
jgi:hypothetical protein